MFHVNQLTGFGVRFAPNALVSYVGQTSFGTSSVQTSETFTSVPIGAADPDRKLIIGVNHLSASTDGGSSSDTITGLTVDGVSATLLASQYAGITSSIGALLFGISVPTGTTADIVVSGRFTDINLGIYRLIKENNFTPKEIHEVLAASGNASATISGSCAVAIASGLNVEDEGSWSGMTENYEIDINSGEWVTGAIKTTLSSSDVVTRTETNVMVVVTWD